MIEEDGLKWETTMSYLEPDLTGFDLSDVSDDIFVLDVVDDEAEDIAFDFGSEENDWDGYYPADSVLPENEVEKDWDDMNASEQGATIATDLLDSLYNGALIDSDEWGNRTP